ncbi:MAG: hypothetical protein HKM89_12695 [Gemmatimonadales bacterium]|nr:hypothetical protein [Gemmatimonadales bacterium]
MEKLGYLLLFAVAAVWLYAMIRGMVALLPYGLVGLAALAGIGLLFAKVVKDRVESTEDDHYSKNVDR